MPQGAVDAASCVFFLPAGETLACKIQFGTVQIHQAMELPLSTRIFTADSSAAATLPGWERRIGDGVGRGPLTKETDVPVEVVDAAWADYKQRFGRVFPKPHAINAAADGDNEGAVTIGEVERLRRRNFGHSLRQIRELERVEPDATFGMTEFSDWSTEEWLQFVGSAGRRQAQSGAGNDPLMEAAADANGEALFGAAAAAGTATATDTGATGASAVGGVDWREKGAITPVKNQGTCGNCWAFSSTASTEAAWSIAGNPLVSLSEEFLTDCNYPQSPGGCAGGFPQQAFKFIIKNGE
eukprot:COSAG06_NODE_1588_length_9007_cov_115.131452_6_plen_297_part_00